MGDPAATPSLHSSSSVCLPYRMSLGGSTGLASESYAGRKKEAWRRKSRGRL